MTSTNTHEELLTIHPTIQRGIPNEVIVKRVFTCTAKPGDKEFIAELDQMKKIAMAMPMLTELIYIGKDTRKFVNFAPIWHGDRVTVVGRRRDKIAVEVQFTSGELCGINIPDLAYEAE